MNAKKNGWKKGMWVFGMAALCGGMLWNAPAEAAARVTMSSVYGGSGFDSMHRSKPTSDGGFIAVGSKEVGSSENVKTNYNATVVKYDRNMKEEWSKAFGGSSVDGAHDVIETKNGDYLVLCYSASCDGDVGDNRGEGDSWLICLDKSGNVKWKRIYGGESVDELHKILDLEDGYILAGHSNSRAGDLAKTSHGGMWVVKINETGDVIWSKTYGGVARGEVLTTINRTKDNGFVLSGYTASKDGDIIDYKGLLDGWVVKINKDGVLEWSRTLGGSGKDCSQAVVETNDGGYLVATLTNSNDGDVVNNTMRGDIWLVKLDTKGKEILWQKFIGGNLGAHATHLYSNSKGCILFSYTKSTDGDVRGNHGGEDFWLVQLDVKGSVEWQYCVGGSGNEDGVGTYYSENEGIYIFAGKSNSSDGDIGKNNGNEDGVVIVLRDGSGPAPTGPISGVPSNNGGGGGGGCNAGFASVLALLGLPLFLLSRKSR